MTGKMTITEMSDFLNDDKRFDAAVDNIQRKLDSGELKVSDLPLAAPGLNIGGSKPVHDNIPQLLKMPLDAEAAKACDALAVQTDDSAESMFLAELKHGFMTGSQAGREAVLGLIDECNQIINAHRGKAQESPQQLAAIYLRRLYP